MTTSAIPASQASDRPDSALAGIVAYVRARPWLYVNAVLALYAFVPGLRRVIDWRSAFSSVNVISVAPLAALVPAAIALLFGARAAKLDRRLVVAAWLWLGAFGYAYAIGIAAGNAPSATYTFVEFVLPLLFGLYFGTLDVPANVLYERIAKFALALSVPVSLYAIYQYVAPPPWDVYWMNQTKFVSIGLPYPFQIRPFSTLNAPAPCADFLMAILILNYPRLRGAGFLLLSAFAVDLFAFILTLVRGDWVAIVLATIAFLALRPHKARNLSFIAAAALFVVLAVGNAGALFGNSQVGELLTNRFGSFTSLSTDTSYNDRLQYFGDDLATAFAQPTGEGLGVVGTAAKLGAAGATVDFDNGYIARFTEMGYFGTGVYLATIAFVLIATFRRFRVLDRGDDPHAAAIAAAAVALQIALIFLDVSADHHLQLPGTFFWLSFVLVFGRGMRLESAR